MKAGSEAERVLVGARVPPFSVVCAGVELPEAEPVDAWDWLVAAAGSVVWGGAPATETVFVEEPQPPPSAPASVPRISAVARRRPPLIASMVFVPDPGDPCWCAVAAIEGSAGQA